MGLTFEVEPKLLAGALSAAVSCVWSTATVQILEYVKLEAGDGIVRVTATDLERQIVATAPAQVTGAGAVCMPGKVLSALMGKLGRADLVKFRETAAGGGVEILTGHMTSELRALDAGDFPDFSLRDDNVASFQITGDDLRHLFGKTQMCLSTEEARYYLNGAFLHVIEQGSVLRAVATDGHRLARAEIDAPEGSLGMAAVIVPRRTVDLVLRLAAGVETLTVDASPSWIRFRLPGATISTKVIEGTFPDYTRVIPEAGDLLVIEPSLLGEVVARAGLMKTGKSHGVALEINNDSIEAVSTSPERGVIREVVEASFEGAPRTIVLSTTYLSAILGALGGGEATMVVGDAGSPVKFAPLDRDDLEYVLMPIRV